MKRTIVGASAALVLALALPTAATAADSYSTSGEVSASGAPAPPSLTVSFTVRTRNNDPIKIKRFKANGIPLTCSDGSTGTTTEPIRFGRDMKVNDKRKFHGKRRLGPSTFVVKGKVRRKGRARGTLRLSGPSAITPGVTCDSGHVTWRVRRD
jgi:hypothetical protein